jgi:hypothetical protein
MALKLRKDVSRPYEPLNKLIIHVIRKSWQNQDRDPEKVKKEQV